MLNMDTLDTAGFICNIFLGTFCVSIIIFEVVSSRFHVIFDTVEVKIT